MFAYTAFGISIVLASAGFTVIVRSIAGRHREQWQDELSVATLLAERPLDFGETAPASTTAHRHGPASRATQTGGASRPGRGGQGAVRSAPAIRALSRVLLPANA